MATDIRYTRHGREITKSGMCERSGKLYQVTVTEEQFKRWQEGELIQRAMLFLSPDDREFMISGTTPDEFRNLFSRVRRVAK